MAELALQFWSFGKQTGFRTQPIVMTKEVSDDVLVEQALAGSEAAFNTIIGRYHERLFHVAFGFLKDRGESEDAVQEAFTRVYLKLGNFQGKSKFYTWLYRIQVNLCLDALRRRRRDRRVLSEEALVEHAGQISGELWPNYDRSAPLAEIERKELSLWLDKALKDLPDIHQAVLILREVEGMSYDEIAKVLDLKRGTVMSRLFHARKKMQEQLLDMRVSAEHKVG